MDFINQYLDKNKYLDWKKEIKELVNPTSIYYFRESHDYINWLVFSEIYAISKYFTPPPHYIVLPILM